ncbi:MAG: coproporphyrinogen III oxidase, partial [Alphaproteobacteria bacterium]|nr:coproporphyrinogen III oxidase [Alphaproteobacteria bacterium]
LTRAMTAAAGLPAYEVSNHAQPGAESHHNLAYWRYQDYLGIGPGAHGRRGGVATLRLKKPENWLSAVARHGHGLVEETLLEPRDRAREALIMGLRLREGVDVARIAARTGLRAADIIDDAGVAQIEAQGLLRRAADHLIVTEAGMLLLDSILREAVR